MERKQLQLEGVWSNGITWKFFVSEKLPELISVTAVAGIVYERGDILLARTRRGWEVPGGHVEKGESNEEALYRELSEEIGVQAVSSKLFGYYLVTNPNSKSKYPTKSLIPHYFVCCDKKRIQHTGDDVYEVKACSMHSPEVMNSDKYEIIKIAHSLQSAFK